MSKLLKWLFPVLLVLFLFFLEIALGSVSIGFKDMLETLLGNPPNEIARLIIIESRLPRAVTATASGGGLALCGLLMQRYFQNPLAGPSVLGITSGASLGVALVVLLSGGLFSSLGVVSGAFVGAMSVLFIILLFASKTKSPVTLLIFGLMIGYLVSASVTILQFNSPPESLRSFIHWGMGSFADRNWSQSGAIVFTVSVAFLLSFALARKLDLWSLGENYARSMGLNHNRFRFFILMLTGTVTAVITAWCGPIAFIGLAVPHLARGFWKSGRHRVLVPAVVLSGMIIGLACDLIARMPGAEGGLPLNAVTSFFGAPVVIIILLKGRRVF